MSNIKHQPKNVGSETFNVRDRSFIKVPEPKCCPTCGQMIAPDVQPYAQHMNNYVNPTTKHTQCMNSNEEELVIGDVTLVREDILKARIKAEADKASTKTGPEPTTSTIKTPATTSTVGATTPKTTAPTTTTTNK